jgi:hypothetical protein
MTERPAKLAAAVAGIVAARGLLGDPSAHHVCRFFLTLLGCLPASTNQLKLLSIWIHQHGCNVDQEYVEKKHLPAGVVLTETRWATGGGVDRRSQAVPNSNYDVTGKSLTCAKRTPYLPK